MKKKLHWKYKYTIFAHENGSLPMQSEDGNAVRFCNYARSCNSFYDSPPLSLDVIRVIRFTQNPGRRNCRR